jgi:hypothetical protein
MMTYPEEIGPLGPERLIADVSARFYGVVGSGRNTSEREIDGER